MKKITSLTAVKIVSILTFVAFYALSYITSDFLYSGYSKYPTLNCIFGILTLISLLVTTALFAKSKTFLFIISIYFSLILLARIFVFEMNISCDFIAVFLFIAFLSFFVPFGYFPFDWLKNIINFYFFEMDVLLIFIPLLVYLVYFISRKLQSKKQKDETK